MGGTKKVLVVEDDFDISDTLRDVFLDDGFEVRCAWSGSDALAMLGGGEPPDVILLDLMMQGMDGFEFRRQQLAEPTLAQIPVVVMTASRQDPQARELDAQGWIHKPFELDELLAIVNRCCVRSVRAAL
jgi:CheY-like chemotaxis protein